MKKLLTLAFCALLGGVMWASTPNNTPANPFQDDLSRLENEFAGMSQLEQLVEERNATYSELAAENNALLQNVNSDTDIASSLLGSVAPDDERLLGIPGFWWGFCFGILGIILVYVAVEGDAKKREGKKAIIGCAIWSVIWIVLYFGIFAASAWWATGG
ncbi:MAG TPA: hypothetical protein VK168_21125 [Saprospiraceae bacterium]|nr:hypothetical protein [Saprospiraceae bacterium]